MGVTYKLTQEVINFILETKKNTPSISCRKLSELVSEKFSRKVSKSSVNTVLKNHDLSASVGRPKSESSSKERKFRIPQERKRQLFNRQETSSLETVPDAEVIKDTQLRPDPIDKPPETPLPQKEVSFPGHERFLEQTAILREEFRQKFSQSLPQGGAALLYAVIQNLGLNVVLARLLEQRLDISSTAKLNDICSALMLLRFLKVKNEEDLCSSRTNVVWALHHENLKEEVLKVWKDISTREVPKHFGMFLQSERDQQQTLVSRLVIAVEDNKQIHLDASLSFLGGKVNGGRSVFKVLNDLSEQIISNKKPAIIKKLVSQAGSLDQLKLFIDTFCRSDSIIKKADLLNLDGEVISEFTLIPQKRRNFIVGVKPTHSLFQEFLKSAKWSVYKPLYVRETDQVCYYTSVSSQTLAHQLGLNRDLAEIILLNFEKENQPKIALISKMNKEPLESIIKKYLIEWTHIVDSDEKKDMAIDQASEVNNTQNISDTGNLMDVIDGLTLNCFEFMKLNSLVEKDDQFATRLEETLCELKCQLFQEENFIFVILENLPAYSEGIKHWERTINHYRVYGYDGKRILFFENT